METTILHDEIGYYRLVEGIRIDTDVNGDWFLSIPEAQYNAPIPEAIKQLITDNFKVGEISLFSDVYRQIGTSNENVIIKSGIYNSQGYRFTKTTDLEAGLTIQLFGFESIIDYKGGDL